jgi:hypothetical protein
MGGTTLQFLPRERMSDEYRVRIVNIDEFSYVILLNLFLFQIYGLVVAVGVPASLQS